MKSALIIGITGQDGSYLSELLVSYGYIVYGVSRNIKYIPGITTFSCDVANFVKISDIIRSIKPDEIYNFSGHNFVQSSWNTPIVTCDSIVLNTTKILEAIRLNHPSAKFYQASSSEMFGKSKVYPQTELTPLSPNNPYGAAKSHAHMLVQNYREHYGMFCCCGITYNHESPRRGVEFVTRKITSGVASIARKVSTELKLGNLQSQRDWGHAKDYVAAMWLMMQQDSPDDYIIASGVRHTVLDWVTAAFKHVGLDWEKYVKIDQSLVRSTEPNVLIGDPTKIRSIGWITKYSFDQIVEEMITHDLS